MYNERWTREKFIEYRKLKKSGYSHKQLKEYFGDDIWESGLYNKNANLMPWLKFINEIKINPLEIPYSFWNRKSIFFNNKLDYFAEFESENIKYILNLMYFEINNISTYNVIFTTKTQYDIYDDKMTQYMKKGNITDDEYDELKNIFETETNFNDIYGIMKRISFVIFDLYNTKIKGNYLSIGETDNYKKIKLYRNIIENSFENITETEIFDKLGNKYYIYKIN